MNVEYRVIPGYEGYCVSNFGEIKSIERNIVLGTYWFNDYIIVDTFRGSTTETLPVHRAVALAWVNNPNPSLFTVVNHLDGNKANNFWTNLEWTDHSGNNYHAVNNGLRNDNIPCRVRDYFSGVVSEFSSMAQAAEFMGLRKDASINHLRPKMFGRLINDRFEFRFAGESEPWFYENRSELITPSRYMVTVTNEDGTTNEVYSTRTLLKEYQLYGAPGKSIPVLAQYGNEIYPDKQFEVRDSYTENQFRETRNTNLSQRMPIKASKETQVMDFESLTKCAAYFNVDRSSIQNRLNNGKELDGWTFTQASLSSNT